ncbi:hypothetical protein N0V93_000281 [Gnomoniopsis smithogilvyi]|uniref:Uncharacterized protein n=1 Tax=Gnomoniopsis smithogilvyi TaxID=1191159 RepID=A0A9W9D182_9PEZI|nr:hypothetical protein N0V93_000281 [Gnomoniopsis smithogilvyi]
MHCLCRLFRSKSSLKRDSKDDGWSEQAGAELDGAHPTQENIAKLWKQIKDAQKALTQLEALVSALHDNADASPGIPTCFANPWPSSNASIAKQLEGMQSSAESLTRILRKHNPLSPTSTALPTLSPDASTPRSDLYPAPLRLPRHTSPTGAERLNRPDAPAPFDQEIRLLDSELRQRHSLGSTMPCPRPSTNRPVSLPIPNRQNPQFSTEAKTRKLRSMQRPENRLDNERPLGMDELMTWLRAGHSMREL